MPTSNDDLRKRYRSLSDSELIELHRAGGLTDEAAIEMNRLLSERGLDSAMIEDIVSMQSNQQRQEYLTSPPKPIPVIWIGFVIAGASLIAAFFDGFAGFEGRFGTATLFFICGNVYWFFCLHRFHAVLKHISLGAYPISPSAAVGFHFVPFYNFYWIFKWPIELVRFLKKNPSIRTIPGWLIGLLLLLSILVGRIIDGSIGLACIFCLFLYLASKLRQGVSAAWKMEYGTTSR